MGAEYIEMKLDGKLSRMEVESEVRSRAIEDRAENDSRSGYSGDWQTVNRIEFRGQQPGYREAAEYIQKNAEKWSYGIAVQYEAVEGEAVQTDRDKAKREKLNAAVEAATAARRAAGEAVSQKIVADKRPNVNCSGCTSRFPRKFLRSRSTVKCVVCGVRLVSATDEAKLAKLDAKTEGAKAALVQHLDACRSKAPKVLKWLVGAWAAS